MTMLISKEGRNIVNHYNRALLKKEFPCHNYIKEQIKKMPSMSKYFNRELFIKKFGFALITDLEIDKIKKQNKKIISVGSGSGYIEQFFINAGLDVICTDIDIKEFSGYDMESSHLSIEEIDSVSAVKKYNQRSVFMSWPSYNQNWAYKTLLAMKKNRILIYIGEGYGGCTGCDKFHELLDNKFEELDFIHLIQWDGIHDGIYILKKL